MDKLLMHMVLDERREEEIPEAQGFFRCSIPDKNTSLRTRLEDSP